MARQSAWGRWYAAQLLVSGGIPVDLMHLYQVAAGCVMEKILDGKLEVRGRQPGQLKFETISRTDWRSSALLFRKDPIALWKMHVVPTGGVEIDSDGMIEATDAASHLRNTTLANYDSLIVDAFQFENLWPTTNALSDKKRRKFLREATRRGLDRGEIQRLSDPPATWWISILFLIIIGLLVLSSYLSYQGKWGLFFHSGTTQQVAVIPPAALPPTAVPTGPTLLPQPPPNLSAQDIATEIIVWKSIGLQLDDLTNILGYGYNMLATWERDFRV